MFPPIGGYLRAVECVLEANAAVKAATVQQVPGRNLVTAVIDMDVKKPLTLTVIAEILEVLNETFGGQQLPNIEMGRDCICISDLEFKPRMKVTYVQHTYT